MLPPCSLRPFSPTVFVSVCLDGRRVCFLCEGFFWVRCRLAFRGDVISSEELQERAGLAAKVESVVLGNHPRLVPCSEEEGDFALVLVAWGSVN